MYYCVTQREGNGREGFTFSLWSIVRWGEFSNVEVYRTSRPAVRGRDDDMAVDGLVELAGSVYRNGHA